MKLSAICVMAVCLLFASRSGAADSLDVASPSVLFVYDTVDKNSKFYIDAFRERLTKKGYRLEEATAGGLSVKDPAAYRCIVIYGMVMAFNMKSPVRKWMRGERRLENGKALIFVTANRWFKDNLRKDLIEAAEKKRLTVVDAVAMATNKVSEAEKVGQIEAFLSKLEDVSR